MNSVLVRNTVAGTTARALGGAATALAGLAVADSTGLSDVIGWGLGAIIGNNHWTVPPKVVAAVALGLSTAVQAGWRWIVNRAPQPEVRTLGSQIHS